MTVDWGELAFSNKKVINDLEATFIVAPRELSIARLTQLLKQYLPTSNIVIGIAKEPYVLGFEDQPQFQMLQTEAVKPIIDKVSRSNIKHRAHILTYFQRDLKYMLEKLAFRNVVLVHGSWKHGFHTTEAYYTLVRRSTAYEMVSPFIDESEARDYEKRTMKRISSSHPVKLGSYTEKGMMVLAQTASRYSFDHNGQTGVTLTQKKGKTYDLLAWAYNKIVPFQSYALHYGSEREKHFSPPNDLNYYDAVHAEVELLLTVNEQHIDLGKATIFINVLPCPTCSRMLADTPIAELIYARDHSDGYAVRLLEGAGKTVRRCPL